MQKAVYELFDEIDNLPTDEHRIYALRQAGNGRLQELLRYVFGSKEWDLPEGAPPFKPCDETNSHGYLWADIRLLYIFLKYSTALTPRQKEFRFISMLENIHPKDAQLLIDIKDKNWQYKNITRELIDLTFPNLIED